MTICHSIKLRINFLFVCWVSLFLLPSTSSFSIPDSNSLGSVPGTNGREEGTGRDSEAMINRRSNIAFLLGACSSVLLFGGDFLAAAETGSCQTECVYKCQQRELQDARLAKLDSKSREIKASKECMEQCQERAECKAPQPEMTKEPRLAKAADIKGLYSRWQDSF